MNPLLQMRICSRGVATSVLAVLALAIGGFAAPEAAQADFCQVKNPLDTLTTVGKGQRPTTVNRIVQHQITGHLIGGAGAFKENAHRIEVCADTDVQIAITGAVFEVTGACTGAGATVNCTVNVADVQKYIARSGTGGGTDTDRITLLPVAVPDPVCVLDPSSNLSINAAILASPLVLPLVGSLGVICDLADPATGKGACDCAIESIDPIDIPGIGRVCVAPGTEPCDPGELECDGGNALDIDLVANHDLGTCTGFADCEAQCLGHCTGLGLPPLTSGCEGFCSEPAHSACLTDADCTALGEGACAGADNFLLHGPGICGCNCLGVGGSPSPAGSLFCTAGAGIVVIVDGGTCGVTPPLITVGEACIPVTTTTVTSVLENANVIPDATIPETPPEVATGLPANCATYFENSDLGGASTVGSIAFFDSKLGDLLVNIEFTCE